jgi:NAD+ kinase
MDRRDGMTKKGGHATFARMYKFHSIGLITKSEDGGGKITATLAAIHHFLSERGFEVYLDHSTDIHCGLGGTVPRREIAETCDLAIVVGGDGTLLTAARSLADAGIPIVGVNLGRLGFLVDVLPQTMTQRLEEILSGAYVEDQRLLVEAEVRREGELLQSSPALNDVVMRIKNIVRMIEFETWINGEFVNIQRADGVVVSTPTGSTAYALSGGGPILHPELDALLLMPICPHTLSSRPIVVNADNEIDLVICNNVRETGQVVSDGQNNIDVVAGDSIRIRRREKPIRLLHPANYDYYHILREKLHWG